MTHERFLPKYHKLAYDVFQVLVDLDDIQNLAKHSRWWSIEKFNAVSFYRKDYLPGDGDLKQTVINKIKSETGELFDGKVFLLANLRYWGYCYNPVSFYFCYDSQNRLRFILDDINNTPWNERHCYVHDCRKSEQNYANDSLADHTNAKPSPNKNDSFSHLQHNQSDKVKLDKKHSFHFDKAFHVSPFMPMSMFYKWHYMIKPQSVMIHMELFDKGDADLNEKKELKFYANISLKALPLNRKNANRLLIKYPFICGKVLFGIYWHALRLWLKKIPFYDHPNS